jgi:hypothetical protein
MQDTATLIGWGNSARNEPVSPGVRVLKLFTIVHNKLECLSLASFLY